MNIKTVSCCRLKVPDMNKLLLIVFCLLLVGLSACATTPNLPQPSAKYVYQTEKIVQRTVNSLWQDTAGLYEDSKARRLNDLITIKVSENISGSGKADSSTSKTSKLDAGIDEVFGIPLNMNTLNFFGRGATITPNVKGSYDSSYKGSGETNREGKLIGTITAKVVEVMPNGNLTLESRKEITINNEKQILILKGMIRPEDIEVDNTISSSKMADAEVYFVGDGIIQDKQSPGWLVRIMDKVWPF